MEKSEIGLSFVLDAFKLKNIDLAEKLGCSKQLITEWLSRRKPIPKKRLSQLSEMFKVPEDYFNRELLESEKLIVKKASYSSLITVDIDQYDMIFSTFDEMIMEAQLDEKLHSVSEDYGNDIPYKIIDQVLNILKENNTSKVLTLKIVIDFLINLDDVEKMKLKDEQIMSKINELFILVNENKIRRS